MTQHEHVGAAPRSPCRHIAKSHLAIGRRHAGRKAVELSHHTESIAAGIPYVGPVVVVVDRDVDAGHANELVTRDLQTRRSDRDCRPPSKQYAGDGLCREAHGDHYDSPATLAG